MAVKLSSSLYDAEISGNKEEADRIRSEIEVAHSSKPKEHVISFNTVLNDEKSSAISVYDFLNKAFGDDWWEWETETLDHMLWIKYSVVIEGPNRDRVFAIRHLCNSDRAFFDWYEFNQQALSFSGASADFEFLKEPSPGMLINAVKTMRYIRPDRENQFGKEVIKYICVIFKNNGIYAPPPSLEKLISEYLKGMISEELVNMWPQIIEKYEKIIKKEDNNIEENIIDIQARRIFSAEASAVTYGTRRTE